MDHESALGRAWRDTVKAQTTVRFIWFGNLIPVAIGGIVGFLARPENASDFATTCYVAIGGVCGVVVTTAVVLAVNGYRAPYIQRNEAVAYADRLERQLLEMKTPRLQVTLEERDPWVRIELAEPDMVRIEHGTVGEFPQGAIVPAAKFPDVKRLLELGAVAYVDMGATEWRRTYSIAVVNTSGQTIENVTVQMTYRRTNLIAGQQTVDLQPGHLAPWNTTEPRFSLDPRTSRYVPFAFRQTYQSVTTVHLAFVDKPQDVPPGDYELHLIVSGRDIGTPSEVDITMKLELAGEPEVQFSYLQPG